MGEKLNAKKVKKNAFYERIYTIFGKYNRALLVRCDNISGKQLHSVRHKLLKSGSELLMGKNSLIRAALNERLREPTENDRGFEEKKKNWTDVSRWEPLVKLLSGNIGIIFTNGEFSDVKEIMQSETREAPARMNTPAQCDVVIPKGSTGLDPKQTSFFQQLDIATKIVKSVIEITTETQICTKGEDVTPGAAALLDKLGIRPFSFMLECQNVIDNGQTIDPAVLEISAEDIVKKYQNVLNNVAAVGLEAGLPNKASARHSIINAFKNLAGVTTETDYSFPLAEKVLSAAAAAPAAGAGAAPAEAAEEEAPKEEEAAVDVGNVFGDDDDDY